MPPTSPRFQASQEGMQKGYWGVIDTQTKQIVRAGFSTKAGAQYAAAQCNARMAKGD